MKAVTNASVVWLMQQTRLVRYFIIAVMLHLALLLVLGSIKIVAIMPSLVAKFTGTALPPPSNEVPDDPYAVYRDFDYSGPTLGQGGGLGSKGPGGVPTAGKGFSSDMYTQGLATLALAEAYVMTRSPILKEPLERCVKCIIKAQQVPKKNPIHDGGWRYNPTSTDADLSVAGWQIMALKSAKGAGIEFDKKVMAKASDYVWNMYGGPGFGYAAPGTGRNTTAVGVLCQQFLGHGNDKRLRPALEYVAKQKMDWENGGGILSLYGYYYMTQAMFQGGRDHWTLWNQMMRQVLLKNQQEDGHWGPPAKDPQYEGKFGPVYTTTLCALMLEVYYRYLPRYTLTDTAVPQQGGALPTTGPIPTAPGG